MPIFNLSTGVLLFANIVGWLILHLRISYEVRRFPDSFFERTASWYRSFPFEKEGAFWQKTVRVRQWKDFLPDGTKIIKKGFDKSALGKSTPDSLRKFIIETRRAELTHWLLIPPAFLFFLWNPLWAGWLMVLYALVANLPFIIIQRYNRPRLERVLKRREKNRQTTL
ncbi:glycosyl-4,4'-diaponeurosporenoate acyltransferase [Jeotgalibaca caeni]|uniref:glycosyl-4,4'-diaponeurosporenoate acyltransferase CrtO family protein n=1 Tax=Jeotgalibaca caeni TaxID=3028623 RepID=UPI00237D8900|nr:glycosyl-4,4'-diaponeurosporenoate acyltransferase [Jeotgalibaca caeni]MDE1549562.1 glycosyl-4,4'-diaponeurosporenoate acyltransferase [Jeotgalibaca caeni]